MAGRGYVVQGPVPAPSPPHCHGCWVLSPQVLVSYYLPDEDVPVATAVLHLTGVSECSLPREGGGGVLLQEEMRGSPSNLPSGSCPFTVPSLRPHSLLTSAPESRQGASLSSRFPPY